MLSSSFVASAAAGGGVGCGGGMMLAHFRTRLSTAAFDELGLQNPISLNLGSRIVARDMVVVLSKHANFSFRIL